MKEKIIDIISQYLVDSYENKDKCAEEILKLVFSKSNISKCPFCLEEMKSFELTHYYCKKCNENFTS